MRCGDYFYFRTLEPRYNTVNILPTLVKDTPYFARQDEVFDVSC